MLEKALQMLAKFSKEDIFAITVSLIIVSGMVYSISMSIRMFF